MNRLTELRELCRREFANLEVLDVGQNKVRELPVALVHFLPNLTTLTLSNNDIEKLPPLLGFHKSLTNLQVEGNPLKQVRRAVIERGTVAILAFLKDKYTGNQDDVVEEWALLREKEHEDYETREYSYQKANYQPGAMQKAQPAHVNQEVGRLMNLAEFSQAQQAKQA